MAQSDEFSEIVNNVLADNTAQGVLKHLRALESNRDHVRTRWIWELLQNAMDASVDSGRKLVASIEQSNDEIVFQHNGNPFDLHEIAHLIYHGSTKVESEEAIGQYGSGFLATHLLSPEVNISGRVNDGTCFDFRLRREVGSVTELRDSLRRAHKEFKSSLSDEQNIGDFWTKFRYSLTGNVSEVVESGISALKQCSPFVIAFNPSFSKITIKDGDGITNFEVIDRDPLERAKIQKISVLKTENEDETTQQYLLAHGDTASIALPMESVSGEQRCLPIHEIPKLFLAFPLIGTEEFSFPAVINSLKFTPTEYRDGVYLGQSDNQINNDNQGAIEEACELLVHLLRFVSSSQWKDIYLLGELPAIKSRDWLNTDWLRQLFKESFIPEIRRTPALVSEESAMTTQESIVPFVGGEVGYEGVESLWDLLDKIPCFRKRLPRRCESPGWQKSVQSWANIIKCEVTEFEEVIDGSKLVQYIEKKSVGNDQECGNLENLKSKFLEDIDAIDWLNELFRFLTSRGLGDIIRSHSIIPSQAGFLKRLSSLNIDQSISGELKSVAESLEWRIHEELRDIRITALADEPGAGKWDNDHVVSELVKRLQDRAEEKPDASFREASVRLFSWIVAQRNFKWLRSFPVFSQKTDRDNRSVIKLDNDATVEMKPLSPVPAWAEGLQKFSELFPKRHTLADKFFELVPDTEIWNALDDNGFLRRDVVIKEEMSVKRFLPDEPLAENEDHQTAEHVTITNIAFLNKGDIAIMERVRRNKKLAHTFVQFLTEWLIFRDSGGLKIKTAQCQCGKEHHYYPAQWLIPLRERKWIPLVHCL